MDVKRTAMIAVIIVVILAVLSFAFISMNTSKTILTVEAGNGTVKNGDYITVLLKDDYRNVIEGQPVDLKILDDSGWAYKYNITTDELGRGYIQLQGFDNGNYTAHATFNGTMFLTDSRGSVEFTIDDGYGYAYY